MAVFSSCFH